MSEKQDSPEQPNRVGGSQPIAAYPGPGRYVVPLSILKDHPREAVALMRLGAVANAITSIASVAAGSLSSGVGTERDAQQAMLLSVSYIKEACDIFAEYGRGIWQFVDKVVGIGFPLPQPTELYKQLFATKGPLYNKVLKIVRHTKGFHIGAEHFRDWLKHLEAPEVTLWHKDGPQRLDWAFTASAEVQTFFGVQIDQETAFMLRHALDLIFIVEAMANGMMMESGYDPRAGWRPSLQQSVRIEYEFRDGRSKSTELMTIQVDAGGTLGRGRIPLLQKFYAVFGGKENTGFVLSPIDGALMHFHSPKGTASVWAEGTPVIPIRAPTVRELIARLDDAASWGRQQAEFALEQLEAWKNGQSCDREAVTAAIERLLGNLDYWKNLAAAAEAAKKGFRSAL